MIYWANLLHIYQPPRQRKEIIRKVARESYWRIFEILKKRPMAKITLNINGSLTEQLPAAGLRPIINGFKFLAERGQIEFTGSAKYHVILALLPQREIIRQIELNNETNRKFFGKAWRPTGFFIPELCYHKKVARAVKKLGFQWIVLDEIAYNGRFNAAAFDKNYLIKNIGLPVFFRNARLSNLFFTAEAKTTSQFFRILREDGRSSHFLITALDGENLGHHQKAMGKLYEQLLDTRKFNTVHFSELCKLLKRGQEVEPVNSSWSSREEDLRGRVYYPLWKDPQNRIHRTQWQLTNLVIKTLPHYTHDPSFSLARRQLDRALHSDQYWWASAKPWWSVEMIEKGARGFLDVLKTLKKMSPLTLKKTESLCQAILELTQAWQDSGRAEKIKKAYLAGEPQERYFGGRSVA